MFFFTIIIIHQNKSVCHEFLRAHCRVCGKGFGKSYKFNCNKHQELLEHYGVDPTVEDDLVFHDSPILLPAI